MTESWLKDGAILDRDITDLEYGTNLKIVYKNRPRKAAGARRVGGGVSIIYNKARCNLRERKIVGNKFELVVAVGRIGRIKRQFAFFCAYIEPRMKVDELKELNEMINAQILTLKARGDPLIFVGGDLNHRSLSGALDDYPDIVRLNHDPTRGDACLDVLHSNCQDVQSSVFPPLETRHGIRSDHACVVFTASQSKLRNFVWVKRKVRTHTNKAMRQFGREMRQLNWDNILQGHMSPDELVKKFEDVTGEAINRLFPFKSVRARSNEHPWITQSIRRLSRLKKVVYKREGKSNCWCRLQEKLDLKIEESKQAFLKKATSGGSNPKAYFSTVKAFATGSAPKQWDLMDLFPGKSAADAGNETATYFTRISDQFEPLEETAAVTARRRPITVQQVAEKLAAAKKPNSAVRGDVLPRLMKEYHQVFAPAVTTIFNAIFQTNRWPAAWKVETTVIIPKTNCPESLAECRNISCTSFLSKVLESVLLEDLRSEIPIDPLQYGGIKGSSVDHLLVDLYDEVLGSLEKGNPAVVLGVDFEKAFNRLNHKECLKRLRELGASEPSLALVRSFLTNRSMCVKVGGELSECRKLCGGSPQGSILGCYLYCAATQHLDGTLRPTPTTAIDPPSPAGTNTGGGTGADTSDEGMGILHWHGGLRSDDEQPEEEHRREEDPTPAAGQHPGKIITVKYVDDTTLVESVPGTLSVRHVAANNPTEAVYPAQCERAVNGIIESAEKIDMRVNCKKTQLLCVQVDNGYQSTATIRAGAEIITSSKTIKLLGFVVNAEGDMQGQVDSMKQKFRRRLWALIHLRRSGIRAKALFKLYGVLVRPILETNCVVFHPMLTAGQAYEIERLQNLVLRLCYGGYMSRTELMDKENIESLAQRREKAVEKFTAKLLATNNRFKERWLIRRNDLDTELRTRRPFVEKRARTERFRRSPLIHIQRTANDLMTR